jgi:hypothetical protein
VNIDLVADQPIAKSIIATAPGGLPDVEWCIGPVTYVLHSWTLKGIGHWTPVEILETVWVTRAEREQQSFPPWSMIRRLPPRLVARVLITRSLRRARITIHRHARSHR